MAMTEEIVRNMILKSFKNIKEIKSIELISEVMCSREFPTMMYT